MTASWWEIVVPLAAAAAIVAFYFLKTRRTPVLVPSTVLWRRTIEDRRVNAFWQRMRRNLLLALQLAAVAAAAIALLRPSWSGTTLRGGRYAFLIDNSASMSASDVEPTRLAEAKRKVLELIDRMNSGDSAMVLSFSDEARVLQPYTDSRELLRRAVAAIEPTARSTRLDDALRLVLPTADPATSDAMPMSPEQAAQVILSSDGNFSNGDDWNLDEVPITFLPIGTPDSQNVALLGLSVVRNVGDAGPDGAQALVKVRNFGAAKRSVDVELRVVPEQEPEQAAERLVDVRRIELDAGQAQDVVFPIAAADDGVWRASLVFSDDTVTADDLALDDSAWAVLAPPSVARGLVVTPGNSYLEAALQTAEARRWATVEIRPPSLLTTLEYGSLIDDFALDFIVYDRCRPDVAPNCSALYLGALPPGERWRTSAKVDVPQVIDVARTHPLFENVSLAEVLIAEATPLLAPSGAQTLVDSDRGVLSGLATRGPYEDVVVGFPLAAADGAPLTNWPLIDGAGFEQFVLNTLQFFGRSGRTAATTALRPGAPLRLRLPSGVDEVRITRPDGTSEPLRRTAGGEFAYYGIDRVGVYRTSESGGPPTLFAANLFDAAESQIAVPAQPKLKIGNVEIDASPSRETSRLEGWRPALLLMLALVLVEWYIYGIRAGR